ncbi:uncharacterized protein LACBIDRAFT_330671 [Laccaria bicolor S238N-H82]|uniref:Predicted protein n=1 Tax=Laccaria bicolor (strain S238N-H82 / ATCC MYA-4686) TaxID=486041 RepID=B0DM30_LACBS|nr:uncharacterized protein LACBIDRAFT_330671 [Laccaria bicolor S238N-H82]EDR04495.1 predicted protein [Laccaria bicolor S238N-H82]|eukprot:XP_001885014.1 predicted protein [Laccaria bicolor S238N-H82]
MSEPRKLRPQVTLPPSTTDADTGGNVIGKSAPTQATGLPTRSRARKITVPVVNTTVNDLPTPAPSCPSRAKKNNSKAVKKIPASESNPNVSVPMVDINRIIVLEDGNEPLVDTEPNQSLGLSMDAAPNFAINLGATQYNDPSQSTAPSADIKRMMNFASNSKPGVGEKDAASEREANSAVVKLTQMKSYCTYGVKQVVLNVADPDAMPTQDLISRGNRDPKKRPSDFENSPPAHHADSAGGRVLSGSIGFGLPLSVQATLIAASARVSLPAEGTFSIKSTFIPINDSSGVLPCSPISGPTQVVSRSHGLYTLRHRLDIPSLTFIDPMLRYRKPKTPDPASSDEDFDSTMPEDDRLPIPLASSLPHPVTVYFCHIGRVMGGRGYIGHRLRIWKATGAHPAHQYTRFTSWFNRVTQRWESLRQGYTTDPPPASNHLGEVEEWWEEATRVARRQAKCLAEGSVGCSEDDEAESGKSADSGDGPESGVRAEPGNGEEAESGNEIKPGHEAEADIESSLTPSDYSQSRKAKKLQLDHARKNRGLGHDVMDTEEEEADDEMIMQETPSGDDEGSGVEGASESPHVRPVASAKALGKKHSNPAPKAKRGPFSVCEMDQVKELADTIVEYCKNMGCTPESVLCKGGFNVSLSREPSWWDVWQMYLRHQSYNPEQTASRSWPTQASEMYKILMENLSEDELEDYRQNMLVELAEFKPEVDQQEFKMTKLALKQVQDLATALGRADLDMIGVIIPRDPVANQAATVITGNPLLQCVIKHSQVDIKKLLHHLTMLLWGMASNFIVPETVDISQLLGVDVANLDANVEGSSTVPQLPPMEPREHTKVTKSLAKKSKSSKGVASSSDPDLTQPMSAVPASYWNCRTAEGSRPMESSRDHSQRCVPYLMKFQIVDCAGPVIASALALWANFFTHCHDDRMILERWPCNEPIPGAKGWSITDISSNGINMIFTYMISKDETKELAPQIVSRSDDYMDLAEGRALVVLAHVRNCLPEVENAARQNDGGADCPPLLCARARSQMIKVNTLKVVKKKKTATTSTQVGRQKRKLREDSKPSGAGVQVEKPPTSDEDTQAGNSCAPVISPIHSPPAKHVCRQEKPGQGADLGSRPVRNNRGGPRDSGWESQEGQHPHSMTQGSGNECGLDKGLNSHGMSQQWRTHDDAGSNRPRGVIPWNDADVHNHNDYDADVNMYDEDGHNTFMDEYQATRITITNLHPSSRISNIMVTIHDSMHHLTLVEEAVASAPNIEDMVVRMTLMATMAKETKDLLGLALAGLDGGIQRLVMGSNSQGGFCGT